MFSWTGGEAIAIVTDGKYKGKILYVDRDMKHKGEHFDEIDLGKNGKLQPVLYLNRRQVAYISGRAGSGKSTYAGKMAKIWRKIFKKGEIYMISRKDATKDPAYNKIKNLKQITIDYKWVTEPLSTDSFKEGSLIIMDDVGSIHEDKIKQSVLKFATDIMEVARSKKIWLIITNHKIIPPEKRFAGILLLESDSVTFFIRAAISSRIRYALESHFELENDQLREIIAKAKAAGSRWITLYQELPPLVLWENGGYILPDEDAPPLESK